MRNAAFMYLSLPELDVLADVGCAAVGASVTVSFPFLVGRVSDSDSFHLKYLSLLN